MTETLTCVTDVFPRTGWPRPHKCGRKAVSRDMNGSPVCKIHSPEYRAAEAILEKIRWDQEDAEKTIKWNGKAFFEALLEIAQGHNNPREKAREAIEIITGKS